MLPSDPNRDPLRLWSLWLAEQRDCCARVSAGFLRDFDTSGAKHDLRLAIVAAHEAELFDGWRFAAFLGYVFPTRVVHVAE